MFRMTVADAERATGDAFVEAPREAARVVCSHWPTSTFVGASRVPRYRAGATVCTRFSDARPARTLMTFTTGRLGGDPSLIVPHDGGMADSTADTE